MSTRVSDMCLAAFLTVFALPALAENVATLHAVYLDAPTTWCAADEGVPVLVKMDGPDVGGATQAAKFYVTQLRGSERIQVEVPPPEDYVNRSSAYTGRFMARLKVCDNVFGSSPTTVEWQVVDGEEILDSGTSDSRSSGLARAVPLFRQDYGSEDFLFRLEERRRLIAKGPIQVKITTEAFASPAQEQSQ